MVGEHFPLSMAVVLFASVNEKETEKKKIFGEKFCFHFFFSFCVILISQTITYYDYNCFFYFLTNKKYKFYNYVAFYASFDRYSILPASYGAKPSFCIPPENFIFPRESKNFFQKVWSFSYRIKFN